MQAGSEQTSSQSNYTLSLEKNIAEVIRIARNVYQQGGARAALPNECLPKSSTSEKELLPALQMVDNAIIHGNDISHSVFAPYADWIEARYNEGREFRHRSTTTAYEVEPSVGLMCNVWRAAAPVILNRNTKEIAKICSDSPRWCNNFTLSFANDQQWGQEHFASQC